MRVYHFVDRKYGLQALCRKWSKLALINQLLGSLLLSSQAYGIEKFVCTTQGKIGLASKGDDNWEPFKWASKYQYIVSNSKYTFNISGKHTEIETTNFRVYYPTLELASIYDCLPAIEKILNCFGDEGTFVMNRETLRFEDTSQFGFITQEPGRNDESVSISVGTCIKID